MLKVGWSPSDFLPVSHTGISSPRSEKDFPRPSAKRVAVTNEVWWVLAMAGLTALVVYGLLLWRVTPSHRTAIRALLVQHFLLCGIPAEVLSEHEELLVVRLAGRTVTLCLQQLLRRCAEAPPQTTFFVRQAVDAVIGALEVPDALPADLTARLVPLLVPGEMTIPAGVPLRPFQPELFVVPALDEGTRFRLLTTAALEAAGLDVDTAYATALRNLDRSCNMLVIDAPEEHDDGEQILRFRTLDGLDAARVLLPSFFPRFSPRFDDADLLVAIPARDTLIMVAADDPAHMNVLIWHARREFSRQAFPLLPVPLLVREDGIAPWGENPDPPLAGTPAELL